MYACMYVCTSMFVMNVYHGEETQVHKQGEGQVYKRGESQVCKRVIALTASSAVGPSGPSDTGSFWSYVATRFGASFSACRRSYVGAMFGPSML